MTMIRGVRLAVLAIAALAAFGVARAGDENDGFFIFLDAAFASPQNTNEVLATTIALGAAQTQSTIRTDFGEELAGRVGFGYKWKNGGSISVHYWRFDTDERTRADGPAGGEMNFAIGPAITYLYPLYPGIYATYYYGGYGFPGSLDLESKIEAETLDVVWSRDHELTEKLVLGWSLGLRYATFEENIKGQYDFFETGYTGYFSYGVEKQNKGAMAGFKAGLRITRNFGEHFAVSSGLGFSFLKGKVESSSFLIANGLSNPGLGSALATASDKDRSGLIRDFDVGCYWRIADDHFRVGVGWEQSSWDGVPNDLLRNTPGSLVNVPERNNVGFSGWKIGLYGRF